MTISKRPKYTSNEGQRDKLPTIERAKEKMEEACELLKATRLFLKVAPYQPKDPNLYIKKAPVVSVDTPKGRELVIAPDIYCEFPNSAKMWVEVKDKPQRAYYPDTGCDVHQYVGFWCVNYYRREPVLLMFIDPELGEMKLEIPNNVKQRFIERLVRFTSNGKPVFYGNWLSHLASYDERTRYPMCSLERSRRIPMKIVYLHVDKMVPFLSANALGKTLVNYQDARLAPEFEVYDKSLRRVVHDPRELSKRAYLDSY